MKLVQLRSELCTDQLHHCRRCFVGKPTEHLQCPPNVFRAASDDARTLAFIFDKPNDNTNYKTSPVVPITAFDDRAGVDPRLARAPSHDKLLVLCRLLGLISPEAQEFNSPLIHITNAVKCDVSCESGQTGRITISNWQAKNCIENYLLRELEITKPRGLVFFGKNAQHYVLNEFTPSWEVHSREVGGRTYKIMRVPHTSPEAFNTHGKKGQSYFQPFKQLLAAIHAGG